MESTTTTANAAQEQPWFLKTSYPVDFPTHEALYKPWAEFESIIRDEVSRRHEEKAVEPLIASEKAKTDTTATEAFTVLSNTTSAEIRKDLEAMKVDESADETMSGVANADTPAPAPTHPFMDGLKTFDSEAEKLKQQQLPVGMENMMRTHNNDLAYRTTSNSLVDLFQELEDAISGPRLADLLQSAWHEDPLITLKIIFNTRSIHLGKSAKNTFYRAAGWVAQNHPLTLIANLRWLSRPIIEKKVPKEGEGAAGDVVIVEEPKDENDPSRFDVRNGVAHGYWKDLLNLLALEANDKLTVLSNPREILNTEKPRSSRTAGARGRGRGRGRVQVTRQTRPVPQDTSDASDDEMAEEKSKSQEQPETEGPVEPKAPVDHKKLRHDKRDKRHEDAIKRFENNPVYRALHLTVARLFAEQLEKDLAALRGPDPRAKRTISLCGKWAPSNGLFHDRHTFVASTIAEILHPRDSLDDVLSPTDTRETYLRYAREQYRKDISALRKHLEVVERDITTSNFKNIKYDRIPSLAMKNYSKVFIKKDLASFEKYVDHVAAGKAKISGATLFPATLVKAMEELRFDREIDEERKKSMSAAQLVEHRVKAIEAKVLDGQWNTLVQRIKDSGTLESSIAVCDVSGSMTWLKFADGTEPIHSSLGLSLLVAEVTKPPFGGTFITFSAEPQVCQIDVKASFADKIAEVYRQPMGYNTDFVSVFEDLILPMAIKNGLKQEEMVKRVVVFSDMQFDEAETGNKKGSWNTSYERIKKMYEDAGYELPELVFWNLNGGGGGGFGETTVAPKPVTSTDQGTSLVSGYSQGMLKVFLDGGSFEDAEEKEAEEAEGAEEEAEEVVVTKEGDGEEDVAMSQPKKKKAKIDPLALVKKAIGHKAYEMLQVYD